MRALTAGVDFGGTSIKVGLVSRAGRVVARQQVASRDLGSPAQFVQGIGGLLEALARSQGLGARHLRGVGLGAPGPVDIGRGLIHSMVNVPSWHDVPLGRLLSRRLGCPVFVDNDANLVALGEWRFGAGRGASQLVCLTLGTGVGGGLILDGALYRGAGGAAGELGHIVVDPRGPRCGCGRRGCLEAHIGIAAILRLGRQALRKGAARLAKQVREHDGELSPRVISLAAAAGDTEARAIWAEVGRWLGAGLADIVNVLNPERIVIGGGVAGAWPWFSASALRVLRAEAMPAPERAVRVLRARLGNSAGIVGAAVLVWGKSGGR